MLPWRNGSASVFGTEGFGFDPRREWKIGKPEFFCFSFIDFNEIRSTQQVQKRLWEIKPSFCQVLGKTEFFCFCLYIDFKVIVYPSPSIQPFLDLYFQVLSLSTSFWSEGSAKGIRGYGMQIDNKMISKPIRCKRCFSVLFICFDVDNREKVSLRHENYFVLLTLS